MLQVETAGRDLAPVAAFAIVREASERPGSVAVWVSNRITQTTTVQRVRVRGGDVDGAAAHLAVEAVELVRASMAGLWPRPPHAAGETETIAAPRPRRRALRARLALGDRRRAVPGPAHAPAFWAPTLTVSYGRPAELGLRLDFIGLGPGADVVGQRRARAPACNGRRPRWASTAGLPARSDRATAVVSVGAGAQYLGRAGERARAATRSTTVAPGPRWLAAGGGLRGRAHAARRAPRGGEGAGNLAERGRCGWATTDVARFDRPTVFAERGAACDLLIPSRRGRRRAAARVAALGVRARVRRARLLARDLLVVVDPDPCADGGCVPDPCADGGCIPPGLLDGLVGYWRFDDGTGSRRRATPPDSGNDGTLYQLDPATAWTTGRSGGALGVYARGLGGRRPVTVARRDHRPGHGERLDLLRRDDHDGGPVGDGAVARDRHRPTSSTTTSPCTWTDGRACSSPPPPAGRRCCRRRTPSPRRPGSTSPAPTTARRPASTSTGRWPRARPITGELRRRTPRRSSSAATATTRAASPPSSSRAASTRSCSTRRALSETEIAQLAAGALFPAGAVTDAGAGN